MATRRSRRLSEKNAAKEDLDSHLPTADRRKAGDTYTSSDESKESDSYDHEKYSPYVVSSIGRTNNYIKV